MSPTTDLEVAMASKDSSSVLLRCLRGPHLPPPTGVSLKSHHKLNHRWSNTRRGGGSQSRRSRRCRRWRRTRGRGEVDTSSDGTVSRSVASPNTGRSGGGLSMARQNRHATHRPSHTPPFPPRLAATSTSASAYLVPVLVGGGVHAGAHRRARGRLLHGRRQVRDRGAQDRADAGVAGRRAGWVPRPRRRAAR
jgi:hypothetical protein